MKGRSPKLKLLTFAVFMAVYSTGYAQQSGQNYPQGDYDGQPQQQGYPQQGYSNGQQQGYADSQQQAQGYPQPAKLNTSSASVTSVNTAHEDPPEVSSALQGASAPDRYVDPGQQIEASIRQFYSSDFGRTLKRRHAAGELYVGDAWAEIVVDARNSQWGKHRVMAYEKALAKAEANYLLSLSSKIAVEKAHSYYSNDSDEVPEYDSGNPDSQLQRIVDKVLTLTEGKLDVALKELGVNPDEFKRLSPPQRHKMFADSLVKKSTTQAMGKLSGVIAVQTFEAQNKSGEHVIGVVIVASRGMKQLADEIRTRRGQLRPDPMRAGSPVYDLISQDESLLIDQFGLRKLYDEKGYPVLISYGQWGNSYRGENKRKLRRKRSAAMDQARSLADQQIAMFVAGNAFVSNESSTGEIVEEFVDVHADGYKEEKDLVRIIDETRKRSEARANANLSGLSDVISWSRPHPVYPDQEVVGVVRVWSPLAEQNMRRLKNFRSQPQPGVVQPQHQPRGANQVQQSKAYMRADDF